MVEASGIILYSLDNLSVITGTIMAKYILEIDDYLYGALITAFMKNDIRAIPPIGVSPSIGMTNADTDGNTGAAIYWSLHCLRRHNRCIAAGAIRPLWGHGWALGFQC